MKAFDKVPHHRLLGKLESYGIRGNILGWLSNFLDNRNQKVTVNNKTSKAHPVTTGIPQGSVLGPVLFVVYINDLPEIVKSDVYLFADDTKKYRKITSEEDCRILQKDLEALDECSRTWLLLFHPKKCKVMTLGKPAYQSNYFMEDTSKQ